MAPTLEQRNRNTERERALQQEAERTTLAPALDVESTSSADKLDSGAPRGLQEKPQEGRTGNSEDGPATKPSRGDRRDDQSVPPDGFIGRHKIAVWIGTPVAILAVVGSLLYWDNSRHFESTDDAFIAARQYSVAPKVSGYITAVPVTDNEHVEVGDVIAQIDQRDYRIALDQARAQVASAKASVKNIDAQLGVQQSQIEASQAQVDQAKANLTFAQQQATRYQELAKTGSGTVQNEQQYSSQQHQSQASLESAQASLRVAQRTLESLKAQRESATASLQQAESQRDQAQLNLSYTTVTAAQGGRITNLTSAIGQFAAVGTALTMFVPDETWVAANYKETQLDAMRPGQAVRLRIDAYPERTIEGHVASLQSGSGTAFSLLPAENATGNYVKIVQRVPVKIVMDKPPADVALGPGMSVVPTVRVNTAPSLYERLRAWL